LEGHVDSAGPEVQQDEKDCLLIGFHDGDFDELVSLMRDMGEDSGTFRDLNLSFAEVAGRPMRALDVINHLLKQEGLARDLPYENCDFLWPVVLYLGSHLARRGFTFDYVPLFHRDPAQLKSLLAGKRYRCVVITTTVYVSPQPIADIIGFLRDAGITAPMVVGGPYVSTQHRVLDPESLSALFNSIGGNIYVISSEGELTLSRLVDRLRSGGSLEHIPNLALRDDKTGDFVIRSLETERNDLTQEPVNYALFGKEAVGEFVSLRTAKSCPFSCSFCGFPARAGKYTYSPVDHVAAELDRLAELGGVTTLTFLDDTFNVPKERFRSILRMMIERKYGFRWNSFYRSDHGDAQTIELMAASGCEGVFLGVESACDRMLKAMNKTARKQDYATAIAKFKEVGIATYASFIVGYPGETVDSVMESMEFLQNVAPTFYRSQLFYLDPSTPVWREREALGVTGAGFEWAHPTMTADQASSLVEQMFLQVTASTWCPQYGFEDWAVYYLMRHGYTLDEVVDYLRLFNRMVAAKFSGNAGVQAPALEAMRTIAVRARQRDLANRGHGPVAKGPVLRSCLPVGDVLRCPEVDQHHGDHHHHHHHAVIRTETLLART
jgi:anaerobic magnesium-protoporphyrin IX monomethyl ester cyclase